MSYSSESFVCPQCGTKFVLKGSKLRHSKRRKQLKPDSFGPFCNYICSGSWNNTRPEKRVDKSRFLVRS